jgi:EAL domain-containing protein (putative c-di-GMP-specific phosphodiesterase class I)
VAEGVEDAAALRVLCELGADIAQGYHFTRPLPAEELTDWVRARRRAARPDAGAWLAPAWAATTST